MTSGVQEAVALASSAGLDPDLWQIETIEVVLSEREDGSWAARIVVIVVPRQNGKGSILEVVELYHLFLVPSTRLIIHSAHEFATSIEHLDRLVALIDETPDLQRLVARNGVKRSHGSEGIHLRDGCRILFKTRTKSGGRGFSGDLVVLDEAMKLPPKAVSALVPTMSAMPNPQVIVAGSAPLDDPESDVLRGLLRQIRGLEVVGDEELDDLAGLEWCCPIGADLDDPDNWQQANPGYPERIGPRAIRVERVMMAADPEGFGRERLGIVDLEDEGSAVIKAAEWAACSSPRRDDGSLISRFDGRVVIAIDVPPDRTHASFAMVGASTLGGHHVEVTDPVPIDLAAKRAKELAAQFDCKIAVAQNAPAWSLAPSIGEDILRAVPTGEQSQGCGDLLDAIRAKEVWHCDEPILDAAVKGAASKFYGQDAWGWARRTSTSDISPLVAVTLARWVFKADPIEQSAPVYAY